MKFTVEIEIPSIQDCVYFRTIAELDKAYRKVVDHRLRVEEVKLDNYGPNGMRFKGLWIYMIYLEGQKPDEKQIEQMLRDYGLEDFPG